jgi:hypothetical protein
MAAIQDSITNNLRDALCKELKSDLPAKLTALAAPSCENYYRAKRRLPSAEFLPAVMVEAVSFRPDVGSFDAGKTGMGLRVYSFYVWAVVLGKDEEQAEERVSAYCDAIDAVVCNNLLGKTSVFDTWVTNCEISAATPVASDQLKAARLTVSVKYWHSVGDTTIPS